MEKITKSSDKVLIDPNEPLILPNGTALVGKLEWFLYALCCLDYQNLPTPMSRIEEFANALITGEVPNIEPQSRAEQFFLAILDGNVSDLPQPQSRSEVLLDKLARGEFDLSDVEPIQSRYELLLAYLIKNGGIGNIDYVLYEFSEAMKTMYNTVEKPFKSLELSGNTLVNCVLEDTGNDDYTSFDEDYSETSFTINGTSEGAIKSATLKGQTLVNLVPKKIIDHIASSDWDGYCCLVQNSKQSFDQWRTLQDLKPNTKYYISCYVETFEDANNKDYCLNNPSVESIFGDSMIVNGVGHYQWLSTTKSELTDEIFIVLRSQNAHARGAIKIRDIMIIEYQQGMENWDIPYFEGMQSVKLPVLTTTGKNLFDNNLLSLANVKVNVVNVGENEYSIQTEETQDWDSQCVYKKIKLKQGEKICVHGSIKNITNVRLFKNDFNNQVAYFNPTSVPTEYLPFDISYTATEDCTILMRFWLNGTNSIGYVKDIMVEIGEKTPYEPFKSNILTTIGKNLFDMNRPYDAITDSQATVVQDTNQITVSSADSGTYVSANFILDKDFFAGKTVTGSCLYESDEKDIGTVQIYYQDGNGEHHYQWIRTPRTFTFPNSFIGDVMLSVSANNTGTPQSNTVTVKNIQLELGSVATSYEPYSEGVTLRGIGDVKDTLDCLTGQVTERIGEIVLDGSEGVWTKHTGLSTDEYDVYWTSNSFIPSNGKKAICDKLSYSNPTTANTFRVNDSGGVFIGVSKGVNITNYLSQNTPKINYNLSQESVKTVGLNVVDQNNTKIDKIHVFDEVTHVNASSDELTPTVNIGKSVSYPTIIKPNTKYTVGLKRNDKPLTVDLGGTEVTFASGETRKTITTPSTLTNDKLSYYGVGAKCNEIMLIEGEIEGNVDYFTGMQSVVMQNQMPILCTTGKNLFDKNKLEDGDFNQYGEPTVAIGRCRTIDYIPVKGGSKLTLSKLKTEWFKVFGFDNNKNFVSIVFDRNSSQETFTIPSNVCFIKIKFDYPLSTAISDNIQLELGTQATAYEPHKTSILSCNDDVMLRGIGDVKDELDCLKGELTERIGEIVLDGSEDWAMTWKGQNHTMFTLNSNLFINETSVTNLICDTFPTINAYQQEFEGAYIQKNASSPMLRITISNSKLPSIDANGLKSYLSSNNVKVIYKTPEKVIKTVDLNVVDQDGNAIPKIKSHKDITHLEVTVPKQSLLPNVSAEVATDNSKDMLSLTTKHQEISEAQSAIQDNIQSQSDEIDTALMATTEIFESILE